MKERISAIRVGPSHRIIEASPESPRRDPMENSRQRKENETRAANSSSYFDLRMLNSPTASDVSYLADDGAQVLAVVTPDSPSASPFPNLTKTDPHTPITGYTYINLKSYQFTGALDDQLDCHDKEDPLNATDYVQDMYAFFREKESEFLVKNTEYVLEHPSFGPCERFAIVDWLIGIHWKFQLVPEVLYLAINLLDRYMETTTSYATMATTVTDLVGLTCLWIAAKQEETNPPPIRDFEYFCPFAGSEIVKMETKILKALDFRIYVPTSFVFLARYLRAAHADKWIQQKSSMILDATLPYFSSLSFLPSQLAAASIFLARESAGLNAWSPTLLRETLYCEEAIFPVAEEIYLEQVCMTPQAVHNKYQCYKKDCVPFDKERL